MPDAEKPKDVNELLELPEFQDLLIEYKKMLDEGFYQLAHKYRRNPYESRNLMSGFIRSELEKLESVNKQQDEQTGNTARRNDDRTA